MILRSVVVLAILSSACATSASAEGLSERYIACHTRANGNTVQDGICGQAEMAEQDARLNKAYQQVMRQLDKDPGKKLALRTEQRSWLKRRDYECKVNADTVNDDCLIKKTATRADELEKQLRF